ncbi:sorting nexin-16-like [Lampris incognitus]|uniref:sorting nexin-16-like n=1 Tax=Lampris incognitus TaxID=2546036 RepID=UPI0024B4F0EC|nr:sorting nexin-16-like [Lampris incognitus]XP_056149346.1 sorting nexin-16-like [Lampris incognitus]
MAAPFVPVQFPVIRTGTCRSWPKWTSSTSSSSPGHQSSSPAWIPWVRGSRSCCPSTEEYPSRLKKGTEQGSSLLEDKSPINSWVERPITPTLMGFEIMEERAKFTVYKILVTGSHGDSWVIFRRYADFARLNDKLKEHFPRFRLALPPKRWFKDNYDMEFLEERQIGLQTFLQNLTAHKDIINSEAVRQFLCLDDPPSPFDSLEESRAFCETLEETNHRLQRELLEKQREIDSLKMVLEDREHHIILLEKKANGVALAVESSEGLCQRSAAVSESGTGQSTNECIGTDTNTQGQRDADTYINGQGQTGSNEEAVVGRRRSITEADRELSPAESCEAPGAVKHHGAYWSTLVTTGSHLPS